MFSFFELSDKVVYSETALECPVNCMWLVIAPNLCYAGCLMTRRQQGILTTDIGGSFVIEECVDGQEL